MRATCCVFIATSLDGFIADREGRLDWLSVVERAGEDYGYRAFFESIDTLVVGRRTYDFALGFDAWPWAGKRCVVLTHGAREARHGEELVSEAPDGLVERLSREGARRIYVDGGETIRQFLRLRLVDELTISVVPALLGGGAPLFDAHGDTQRLELLGSQSFESGLVQLRYRVARGR
jgi:dihydrofolate reductase